MSRKELPNAEQRGPRRSRSSQIKTGRVIGERREKLETASERTAARNKIKRRARRRVFFVAIIFIIVAVVIGIIIKFAITNHDEIVAPTTSTTVIVPYAPTIEVIDEDTGTTGTASLTSRMKEYIGQAEADFRELGYVPVKAVIPAGAIREVDFYLDGVPGYIKTIIDRGTGVSVEDADRMLRYLAGQNVTAFQYIDVRIDGKAYWK